MLPFLKKPQTSSIIIKRMGQPDTKAMPEKDMSNDAISDDMRQCAEQLMRAIESKSVVELAHAMKAMCQMIDMEPHIEGPHSDEEEEGEDQI